MKTYKNMLDAEMLKDYNKDIRVMRESELEFGG